MKNLVKWQENDKYEIFHNWLIRKLGSTLLYLFGIFSCFSCMLSQNWWISVCVISGSRVRPSLSGIFPKSTKLERRQLPNFSYFGLGKIINSVGVLSVINGPRFSYCKTHHSWRCLVNITEYLLTAKMIISMLKFPLPISGGAVWVKGSKGLLAWPSLRIAQYTGM